METGGAAYSKFLKKWWGNCPTYPTGSAGSALYHITLFLIYNAVFLVNNCKSTFFNRESYNSYHFVGKKIAIPMKVDSRHVIYLYRAGGSGCAGFVTILSKYQALARTIWIYVLMGIPLVL